MGLQQVKKACSHLALQHHGIWNRKSLLCVACLGWGKIIEVTGRTFWGLRLVEDLEVVLRVKDFNHFFFFFDGLLGRSCLVLGSVRGKWLHLLHTL